METQKFLGELNRKAIFSVMYLIIALGFIFAYLYFWDIYKYDYSHNGLSLVSLLDDMLDPFVELLLIMTLIIYGGHFFSGAFYYPNKCRSDIKMDIESADPETEKDMIGETGCRGIFICLVWTAIFFFAFYGKIPTSTLVGVIISWNLLHIALEFLTSTARSFKLVSQTLDLTVVMPEEYPEDNEGCHTEVDLYFFIPKSVEESTWKGKYVIEYIKNERRIIEENKKSDQQIKDFSEKISKQIR